MKKLVGRVVFGSVLVGCGTFGTDSAPAPPPEEQLAPPSTPQDNAQPPPVDGTPVVGVYVSASQGNDEGTGSSTRPLKTLKKAFAVGRAQQLRVIACAETYEESLTLLDGVSAYGYYECAATPWKRGDRRAIVKSPTSPAAAAQGLTLPTRIEGFEIVAPDSAEAAAEGAKGTSIALDVRDSRELTISGCKLHAGRGAPGVDGKAAPANAHVTSPDGKPGVDQGLSSCPPPALQCEPRKVPGPAGGSAACATGPTGGPGGGGGDGMWIGLGGMQYVPATNGGKPTVATADTAAGGAAGFNGTAGTGGTYGVEGVDGASGAWSFTSGSFVPGDGTAGQLGGPGQGGGGGGASNCYRSPSGCIGPAASAYYQGATGGGGGAGGCIGLASEPGTGGGASVGLMLVASGVKLESTRIETSDGGRAGRGYLGGAGVAGGQGGPPGVYAARGGRGGDGGNAGISGHGAPGPSIALVYSGTRPVMDQVDLAPGPGGAGWPEETLKKLNQVVKTLPAVTGQSLPEYEIKP